MESKNGSGKKAYLYETVADAIETDLLNGEFDKKLPAEQIWHYWRQHHSLGTQIYE